MSSRTHHKATPASSSPPTSTGRGRPLARWLYRLFAGIGVLAFLPAALFLTVTFPFGFFALISPCSNLVERSVPSPSGEKAVIIYEHGCGGVLGTDMTQASVARNAEDFKKRRPSPFFSTMSLSFDRIRVTWLDENHVVFEMPEDQAIGQSIQPSGDIVVEYR